MSTISDRAITTALGRQMTQAVARETVAASNLANLDTPGYRSREATFADTLEQQLGTTLPMARTSRDHLGGTGAATTVNAQESTGLAVRRDGNNVQLDRELVALNRAVADFSAAQTALTAKFRLVRYAINEGR
jgi:flagellar basal-body rod protein FlgB